MADQPAPPKAIDPETLSAAIAIALKLGRFRPSRHTTERHEIYAKAAEAVVESFAKSGWAVVRTGEYPGFASADILPNFGQRRRGEACDD